MTQAGQRFWREREARVLLPLNACPCCNRPLPARGAIDEIAIDAACSAYGISPAALTGPSKTRRISAARSLVVWALRTLGDQLSYGGIGALLGGRHHSTIVSLHQNAIAMRLRDSAFDASCRALAAKLQQKENDNGSI